MLLELSSAPNRHCTTTNRNARDGVMSGRLRSTTAGRDCDSFPIHDVEPFQNSPTTAQQFRVGPQTMRRRLSASGLTWRSKAESSARTFVRIVMTGTVCCLPMNLCSKWIKHLEDGWDTIKSVSNCPLKLIQGHVNGGYGSVVVRVWDHEGAGMVICRITDVMVAILSIQLRSLSDTVMTPAEWCLWSPDVHSSYVCMTAHDSAW